MTISELRDLLTLGKEFGLKEVSFGEFKAVFFEESPSTLLPSGEKMPTEEEFLYMSSGYDPKMDQDLETPRIPAQNN